MTSAASFTHPLGSGTHTPAAGGTSSFSGALIKRGFETTGHVVKNLWGAGLQRITGTATTSATSAGTAISALARRVAAPSPVGAMVPSVLSTVAHAAAASSTIPGLQTLTAGANVAAYTYSLYHTCLARIANSVSTRHPILNGGATSALAAMALKGIPWILNKSGFAQTPIAQQLGSAARLGVLASLGARVVRHSVALSNARDAELRRLALLPKKPSTHSSAASAAPLLPGTNTDDTNYIHAIEALEVFDSQRGGLQLPELQNLATMGGKRSRLVPSYKKIEHLEQTNALSNQYTATLTTRAAAAQTASDVAVDQTKNAIDASTQAQIMALRGTLNNVVTNLIPAARRTIAAHEEAQNTLTRLTEDLREKTQIADDAAQIAADYDATRNRLRGEHAAISPFYFLAKERAQLALEVAEAQFVQADAVRARAVTARDIVHDLLNPPAPPAAAPPAAAAPGAPAAAPVPVVRSPADKVADALVAMNAAITAARAGVARIHVEAEAAKTASLPVGNTVPTKMVADMTATNALLLTATRALDLALHQKNVTSINEHLAGVNQHAKTAMSLTGMALAPAIEQRVSKERRDAVANHIAQARLVRQTREDSAALKGCMVALQTHENVLQILDAVDRPTRAGVLTKLPIAEQRQLVQWFDSSITDPKGKDFIKLLDDLDQLTPGPANPAAPLLKALFLKDLEKNSRENKARLEALPLIPPAALSPTAQKLAAARTEALKLDQDSKNYARDNIRSIELMQTNAVRESETDLFPSVYTEIKGDTLYVVQSRKGDLMRGETLISSIRDKIDRHLNNGISFDDFDADNGIAYVAFPLHRIPATATEPAISGISDLGDEEESDVDSSKEFQLVVRAGVPTIVYEKGKLEAGYHVGTNEDHVLTAAMCLAAAKHFQAELLKERASSQLSNRPPEQTEKMIKTLQLFENQRVTRLKNTQSFKNSPEYADIASVFNGDSRIYGENIRHSIIEEVAGRVAADKRAAILAAKVPADSQGAAVATFGTGLWTALTGLDNELKKLVPERNGEQRECRAFRLDYTILRKALSTVTLIVQERGSKHTKTVLETLNERSYVWNDELKEYVFDVASSAESISLLQMLREGAGSLMYALTNTAVRSTLADERTLPDAKQLLLRQALQRAFTTIDQLHKLNLKHAELDAPTLDAASDAYLQAAAGAERAKLNAHRKFMNDYFESPTIPSDWIPGSKKKQATPLRRLPIIRPLIDPIFGSQLALTAT